MPQPYFSCAYPPHPISTKSCASSGVLNANQITRAHVNTRTFGLKRLVLWEYCSDLTMRPLSPSLVPASLSPPPLPPSLQGGEYSEFAGHDISRRVARGVSRSRVDVSDTNSSNALLDDLSLEGFDRFEKMTLRGWEDTFKARGYPRLGRVVAPPPPRFFSRAELRAFDGRPAAAEEGGEEGEDRDVGGEGLGGQASEGAGAARGGGKAGGQTALGSRQEKVSSLPANYAAQPIYLGVKDKVFDVSFGGSEFYLEGGAYQCLAGRDASRVLAKMSMTPEDIEGVLDYACLTSREEKNLGDWVEKLGSGGKGYPVVGWIDIGL